MTEIDRFKLGQRLRQEIEGEVYFDDFTRGRYSTDASIYQIVPGGVVVPRHREDVVRTLQIASDEGIPIIPRGAGTSQCGQTIGSGLVVDTSKFMSNVLGLDVVGRSVEVEPGVVLDDLNASLKPHGLFFPVDVATASQATIGGMAGNNSAGARSIMYGIMADNVESIDALLADGTSHRFAAGTATPPESNGHHALYEKIGAIHRREADEIARRVPKVLRHVAGYNLHRLAPSGGNLAELLVGSEGTLAFFTSLELALQPIPPHRVLGVCHFPSLHAAMDAVQHIVELKPSAVELTDHTLISLARNNPAFRDTVERFLRGDPEALLVVEFSGTYRDALATALGRLDALMGDLGFRNALVRAEDAAFQREVWSVRKAGLNIVMSMKGDGKPVSFIEDCTVPLEHLAEYTDAITTLFAKHGTSGTFYAHASVGCLHVRPILNLKQEDDVVTMRAIAEEAHDVVRRFGGSHSGEHGDGIVRSEFLEPMMGQRLVRAFGEIKTTFDPEGRFNPGKIVAAPRMDDRSLMRYAPGYKTVDESCALDWSDWGGFDRAVEMCNNNGACRKRDPGLMCPSYRVTRDERDTTRGRANTLRLALTGQLGDDALTSESMYETMDLCVGCKACRRECPTGVDMARMKIEFLHQYYARHGMPARDRLIANIPRIAPLASRIPWLFNAPHVIPLAARAAERVLGFSAKRGLPRWRRDVFRDGREVAPSEADVVLWADTFNTYFEPENAWAALRVLEAGGYRVAIAQTGGQRPLCCGRTYLNAGLITEAKEEARRVVSALTPYVRREIPIVGLEPSCLLTLRDEFLALPGIEGAQELAGSAMLLEEFLTSEASRGTLELPLKPLSPTQAFVHGHCHQKAFGVLRAVHETLELVPQLDVNLIDAGCCGMAGSFGYEARHYDTSMAMAELQLLPAVRQAPTDAWIVADGTSCRKQIADGSGREAMHVARVLDAALE